MKERDKKRLKKLGSQIAAIRTQKGISMRELATLCDIDFSKISKIENNKANLTVTTLFEIADGLGVHPRDLIPKDID